MTEAGEKKPVCAGCGTTEKIYESGGKSEVYCMDCLVKLTGDTLEENERALAQAPAAKFAFKNAAAAVLVAAALGLLAFRFPAIRASFDPPASQRQGAFETDAAGERCILNLWEISARLQEGKRPGPGLACPSTGADYQVEEANGDTLVRCPNPQEHALSGISVSRRNPIPRLEQ